ncbi:hypothetical protein LSCM1_05226 [Leishmania martiniquensis]|uniref:Uncharacterized protein n=1 Tax=Leishmania martiniquensis TaxID=1580590 RepID=A0A836GN60_9TRYP|nr:hypothetical protein LSCM1_05226 [Leishmania martiniquensis]
MSCAEAEHTDKAAAAHEESSLKTGVVSPKGVPGAASQPWSLTPAERRGLMMVVAVALLQEVHCSVFRGAVVGAVSAALVYSQLSRVRARP